ncbi:MAG: pyrroloquinoline quinone biosynthesis peptide chaperone PqqD [Acidocella sp.]|nr:pyrroloquinoline quinone biosynthesis peptide chaperone PqqD [Acidocella sp.]
MSAMAAISAASSPALRRGVRQHFDTVRGAPILQAPERVVVLDDIALAIIELCDGRTSIAAMSEILAARFAGEAAEVEADVLAFIGELADKGLVSA